MDEEFIDKRLSQYSILVAITTGAGTNLFKQNEFNV